MLTNQESEIFIEVYIMDFTDLKLPFKTHKQKHFKTHTQKNNKEEKHTSNNMDGGFDNAFYYKQNQLKHNNNNNNNNNNAGQIINVKYLYKLI